MLLAYSRQIKFIANLDFLRKLSLCFLKCNKPVAHSWHTFIDGLRNAGVEKSIAMKLVGHHSSNDIHNGYGYGHSLEVLQEHIDKLSFPI